MRKLNSGPVNPCFLAFIYENLIYETEIFFSPNWKINITMFVLITSRLHGDALTTMMYECVFIQITLCPCFKYTYKTMITDFFITDFISLYLEAIYIVFIVSKRKPISLFLREYSKICFKNKMTIHCQLWMFPETHVLSKFSNSLLLSYHLKSNNRV